jgi:hypothetical protein
MMSPFKSRSARAQTHYARHINKVAAGNEFATPLMLNALYAACEEWYVNAGEILQRLAGAKVQH